MNDCVWYFLPWIFPKGLDTFEEYVAISQRTLPDTRRPTAIHVQIKSHVLENNDWSWLPRTYPGKGIPARDNRYLKLAAAFIYQSERCKAVSATLAEHFRVWTQSHSIRDAPIGGN